VLARTVRLVGCHQAGEHVLIGEPDEIAADHGLLLDGLVGGERRRRLR
jgi:hypothetical protein